MPGELRGGGTRAGPKPLLPSLGAAVKNLSGEGRTDSLAGPYKTRPGRAGEASFTARLPNPRRARDAVAAEPAGH